MFQASPYDDEGIFRGSLARSSGLHPALTATVNLGGNSMQDVFVGTWRLNVEQSQFDPKHVPTGGTLVFERDAEGCYLMKAEGINAAGEKVAERPQRFHLDGVERPMAEMPGLTAVSSRPDLNTIVAEG